MTTVKNKVTFFLNLFLLNKEVSMRISYDDFYSLFPEGRVLQGSLEQELFFSVDSRTIGAHEIFIPFKGSKVDGHDFVVSAFEKCRGVFIASGYEDLYKHLLKDQFHSKLVVLVDDPEQALIKLASWWRSFFTFPVVGITGSVGKTSTKLIIESILKYAHKNAFVAQGNQNTAIGVALNIVRLSFQHECAIFELGIGKTGEMEKIVKIVQPTIAIITAIGHSHLEGLGTLHDVSYEKRKIFSLFDQTNIGIINGDSLFLNSHSYHHPVVRFGKRKSNHIQARAVVIKEGKLSFTLKIYHNKYEVTFDTTHESYIYLVLGAVAVAYQLGIDQETIMKAVQQPIYRYRRFEKKPLKYLNSYLIDDAYNASPESTKAALIAFDHIPWQGQKIVVLGDMKELGENSILYHKKIGRLFFKLLSIDHLILVGNHVHCINKIVPKNLFVTTCNTVQEAQNIVDQLLGDNMLVLFKASLGMNFIELVNYYSVPYKAHTL